MSGKNEMKHLKLRFVGVTSLMQHNDRLSLPGDPYTQELKRLNALKKQKGVDREAVELQVAQTEWEGGLYYDHKEFGEAPVEGMGVYIPSKMIRASIQAGAKLKRRGKQIERALVLFDTMFKLDYKGPQTFEELAADRSFCDIRSVTVGRVKVPRARPIFPPGWSVDVDLYFIEPGITAEELVESAQDAGLFHGFGDARQLGHGRFQVMVLQKAKAFKGGPFKAFDASQAAH